jgi:asparagine synthase (glutamine-hydrolysing)
LFIQHHVRKNELYGWKCVSKGTSKFYFAGKLIGKDWDIVHAALLEGHALRGNTSDFLMSLRGQFAFIFEDQQQVLAVVDKVRSRPILFHHDANNFFVFSNKLDVPNELSNFSKDMQAGLELAMSGYTLGNKTLLEGIRALQAGEALYFDKTKKEFEVFAYYKYLPTQMRYESRNILKAELGELTLGIMRDMVKWADGRQIVVPLSGGYDSRVMVSALKELNYKNVFTFSYGAEGNFEAQAASQVAKKLDYEWQFFNLRPKFQKHFFQSQDWKNYCDFSNSFTTVPFVQDVSVLPVLKQENKIQSDAILINGNSGDYISGGHILPDVFENESDIVEQVVKAMTKKHYALWGFLATPENKIKIANALRSEISNCLDANQYQAWNIYEYIEFLNRQSKYVISGQRSYEYWGNEWYLPLWDDLYLDFWKNIPLEFKLKQNLYTETMKDLNWGGVWKDIQLNRKFIRPLWVIPTRAALKALCLPFGAKKWHQIERNFLVYWTESVASSAIADFSKVAFDRRGMRHGVSWLVENYLENQKIQLKDFNS